MGFPIFDMPFAGNPLLIAADAILHVFISHGIAIGASSFIVLAEWVAWRRDAPQWEAFARRMVKPTAIVVFAVGAPTGAGIWLITSVIAPRAIGSLLRVFFWPWFVEWLVFTGEVILLLVYLFTWDQWTGALKRRHVRLGFAYLAFSTATAALISGILGFMLTPDGWPWQEGLRRAFLNPSYPPQLVLRLALGVLLGALYTVAWLAFTRQDQAFRRDALQLFGKVAGAAAAVAALAGAWYLASVPAPSKAFLVSSWGLRGFSQAPVAFVAANAVALALVALFVVLALRGRGRMRTATIAAAAAALAVVAELEFTREALRKPYLVPGYMYANQILVREVPWLAREGLLRNSYWYNATVSERSPFKEGAYLFLQNCSRCHSIGGFNDIRERLRGRPLDGVDVIVGHTSTMVPFMPPFAGNDAERRILSQFLFDVTAGRISPDAVRHFSIRDGGITP